MPHAVIDGALTPERIFHELEPFHHRRDDGTVLRVGYAYLSRSKEVVLLDGVVVDGCTRHFLIEVVGRGKGLTVRPFPLTDPEKTDGVKQLIAETARRIRALDPSARIVRTNLPGLATDAAGE